MKPLPRAIRLIDALSERSGRMVSLLVYPLVVILSIEVFSRYLFKSPTFFAFDLTYMIYGVVFMLGAPYTLLHKGHIRTDVFYHKFSPRWQGGIDAAVYLLLFFPGMLFFLIAGWDYFYSSWSIGERSSLTFWRPPIYPYKAVIPLTALLLLLQGIAEFAKSLYAALKGEWPDE
ncbi:MAG: TRAP transporter small permease subunit [Desulfobacterales bacterium]|nr:TRAP transporter small permease subunit [Desulfobacterales bacterium]MCU0586422.1 TRAP transporter small permease subunit [Desulfobacterales bacterium]